MSVIITDNTPLLWHSVPFVVTSKSLWSGSLTSQREAVRAEMGVNTEEGTTR